MFSSGDNNSQHNYSAGLRGRIQWLVETPWFQNTIIVLICINGVTLGLVTSDDIKAWAGGLIPLINQVIIGVFVVEVALRIVAWGPRFFRGPWNLFDFFVVAIALVPDGGAYSVLRALRILRLLRLISQVGRLRIIVESLLRALPGIGWIGVLLLLVYYVFAVMGTELYGESFPEFFGTVGLSMYTLFQVMTLESWSEAIARPVMEQYAGAWFYFVTFILVSAFTVLNLFIGIIVNSMQSLHWEEEEEKRMESEGKAHTEREEMLHQIKEMNAKIDRLERRLSNNGERDGSG
ncbi:voltage-gated sodium channel subunit [Halorhodospira halochloris]|uniref:Voltage-gated sodium channel subunit n=1 Tax=Halorhodospira halochloris TaxID=1052 RepID=A0A0X8X7I0_HALHR|nr:ion transporter [Halorhodospira halochloris]MBK1652262.1 voltage-gated sodium channel [Halorhodospira halochloris]BAU56944.1 voltage-gated sodium channel subunit [Halorhodospira halochloris]